jgi:hypothetical protein
MKMLRLFLAVFVGVFASRSLDLDFQGNPTSNILSQHSQFAYNVYQGRYHSSQHELQSNDTHVDSSIVPKLDYVVFVQPVTLPLVENAARSHSPRGLIIIDDGIPHAGMFIAAAYDEAEVLVLSKGSAGVREITEFFLSSPAATYSTVTIVSAGGPGLLLLGKDALSASTLHDHEISLRIWASKLTANADVHLLGCNVASTPTGRQFVNHLGALLHSNIAASDDVTWAWDWELEYTFGTVTSPLPLDLDMLMSYPASLEILVDVGYTLMNLVGPIVMVGTGTSIGTIYKYKNVTTRNGVSVDMNYTLTDVQNLGTYTADANTNPPWFEPSQAYSAAGYVDYLFEFYLANTDTKIYLTNFCKF